MRFSVLGLVILGLMMDVLCPNVMGVHALALSLPSCLLSSRARRFNFCHMPQQMLWMAGFSLIYQLILASLAYRMGYPMSVLALLLPVITSTLLWPWLVYLLDKLFLLREST